MSFSTECCATNGKSISDERSLPPAQRKHTANRDARAQADHETESKTATTALARRGSLGDRLVGRLVPITNQSVRETANADHADDDRDDPQPPRRRPPH